MKFFVTIYHYILSSVFPAVFLMLVFPIHVSIYLILTWSVAWVLIYAYIDKCLLYFLGAREVAALGHSQLFQFLKNRTSVKQMKTPRIYSYSGRDPYSAIVLHSRDEWTLVLEERFLNSFKESFSEEQLMELTDYFVAFKERRSGWLLTKSIGITSLTIYAIFQFWKVIFFSENHYRAFKVFSLFTLSVFKPFFDACLLVYGKGMKIKADRTLADLYELSAVGHQNYNHSVFLLENLVEIFTVEELIVNYVENFSSLRFLDIDESV